MIVCPVSRTRWTFLITVGATGTADIEEFITPSVRPRFFRRWSIENSVLSDWLLFSVFSVHPPPPPPPVFYSLRALTPSPSLSDDTNEISRNKKKKKKKKAKRKENFNGKRATEILARKVMPVAMATGVSC